MKQLANFKFSEWLAGRRAVSFCLAIGVLFLITNYQGIIFRANPENLDTPFAYPYPIQVILSHLDSFFFGLATAIIIFQGRKEWQKLVYCGFEAIMIFLNLNRHFLTNSGLDSQAILATYIAVFSGFTLYFLGTLAKYHLAQQTALIAEIKEEERAILESLDTGISTKKP